MAARRQQRPVDLPGARLVGQDGVRDAHRQVLVPVEADLCLVADLVDDRLDAGLCVTEDEGTGGVHDVDALGARVGHDACLLRELGGAGAVRQHEEPDRLHPQVACGGEVLDRDVRLGAVGRHPGDRRARVEGLLQVAHGAQAGKQEDGDLRLTRLVHGCRDELHVVDGAEAVVEAGAAEPVTVRDLDDLHAGGIECVYDRANLVLGEAMRHRVAAVPQRRVRDPDRRLLRDVVQRRHAHAFAPTVAWAIRSPTRAAAAVMMSRLPAYVGR